MGQPEFVEGLWEEIVSHRGAQLAGCHVRIAILSEAAPDSDAVPDAENESRYSLEAAITKLNNRTEEEIDTARRRILATSKKPLPLPAGETLADVIMGQWPGQETDKEIHEALCRLS